MLWVTISFITELALDLKFGLICVHKVGRVKTNGNKATTGIPTRKKQVLLKFCIIENAKFCPKFIFVK